MKKMQRILLAVMLMPAITIADYSVDRKIGQGRFTEISQIAIGLDNRVLVLEKNGKVTAFNEDGSLESSIETGLTNTDAIAMDAAGNLFVFSTQSEEKKKKVGARMVTVQVPVGVTCGVYDSRGTKVRTVRYPALQSAKAAEIIGDRLVVADLAAQALVIMDPVTGEETARIKKGLRLCCGIFDICEAPDDTVAISNLGAFKLQQFDLEGNLLVEFGRRGRELSDFQGCCNPVSAEYLPDGRILTVEKDPTRIKIYDAEGKNPVQINGVEELVKGCEYIPVAIDSAGNIYLANNTGYLVKCTP